jgi:hypothetical protein
VGSGAILDVALKRKVPATAGNWTLVLEPAVGHLLTELSLPVWYEQHTKSNVMNSGGLCGWREKLITLLSLVTK